MRTLLPLIAVLTAATPLAASPLTDAADDVVVSMTIDYSDTDLSDPEDIERLKDRIQHRAKLVCTKVTSWSAPYARYDRSCTEALVNAAFGELESVAQGAQLASN